MGLGEGNFPYSFMLNPTVLYISRVVETTISDEPKVPFPFIFCQIAGLIFQEWYVYKERRSRFMIFILTDFLNELYEFTSTLLYSDSSQNAIIFSN